MTTNKPNLIGISGKIGSGKDTVGRIIQWLNDQSGQAYIGDTPYGELATIKDCIDFINSGKSLKFNDETEFEIKKFADKIKDIVCLLIGCTRKQLEDREFKETELGKEWWTILMPNYPNSPIPYLDTTENERKAGMLRIRTPRTIMQLLGTEAGRDILHPNIWVNALFADYKVKGAIGIADFGKTSPDFSNVKAFYPNWIITDVRFPNEVKAIKDRGGIVIRLARDLPEEDSYNHYSETALDGYKGWDHIIDNNGSISDLVQKVNEVWQQY